VSINARTKKKVISGEWQDRLVDEISARRRGLAGARNRTPPKGLGERSPCSTTGEAQILEARRLEDDQIHACGLGVRGTSLAREGDADRGARPPFEKVQRAVQKTGRRDRNLGALAGAEVS